MTPAEHVAPSPATAAPPEDSGSAPGAVRLTPLELIERLTEALQETRILAAVQYEGDPWYAEYDGLDATAIFTRARDVLEDAEEYRAERDSAERTK